MNRRRSSGWPITSTFVLLCGLWPAEMAWAQQGELAPEKAADTLSDLEWRCKVAPLCPYSTEVWGEFLDAVAGKPASQLLLGIYLMTGDKVARDERGGLHWIGLAAAQGYARAALELNRLRRGGTEMDVDEGRIAAAMRAKADAGDADAMRALSDMYIYGRGVGRDANEGVLLLRKAAETGSAEAEQDLANLLFVGAPGVAQDHMEALRRMASAGSHGNTEAMRIVSYWLMTGPPGIEAQPIEAYRWLMRAALLDDPYAQEKLSQLFADGMNDRGSAARTTSAEAMPDKGAAAQQLADQAVAQLKAAGAPPQAGDVFRRMTRSPSVPKTLIAPDLVQADKWFRLAARSPWHDNPQIRASIEPHMTTAQLDEARRQAADWHPLPLPEVLALDLPLPALPAGASKP
jgi:TPR repeat protein